MPKGVYKHNKRKHKQTFLDILNRPPSDVPEEPSSPKHVNITPTTGTTRLRMGHGMGGEASDLIADIKYNTAGLINTCQMMKGLNHPQAAELERLCTLAQARYEEASMWAVKAATL
jgi:hypothetical protein